MIALLLAVVTATSPGVDVVRSYREAHAPAILQSFDELLRMPNVARDTDNIRRNAAWLVREFNARGFVMETLEVEGAPPLVVGRRDTPGATRTIGLYVHYDGQPVDESEWTTPPWAPVLRTGAIESGGEARPFPVAGEAIDPEWRLYGRSTGDDKAPLIALLTALDALAEAGVAATSNLVLMFEGEEEAGSMHLREYFARYGERLGTDVWLICDGPVHQSRHPQIVFGVRGITSLQITVYGASRSLHSGHYGNWAPNPGHRLARLIASMKDDDGRVLIDGFYDDVVALSSGERAALAAVPEVDEQLRGELAMAPGATEGSPATLAERLLLPSLNVQGIESGAVGPRARNVIPNSATAAIDIRVVKGNDPARMLDLVETHIRSRGYHIVRREPDAETRRQHDRIAYVRRGSGYRAARTSMDLPIVAPLVRAAEAAAAGSPDGADVVLVPSLGGSLPLYLFEDMLETPTIIMPIANHDNNQHAPDENIRLANLWYGIDLMGAILTMEDE